MSHYDVIFIALARWDGDYSSTAFSIAKEWSRTHRIYYIENPYTLKDFVTEFKLPRIKTRIYALLFRQNIFNEDHDNQLVTVIPPLVLPINWLPQGKMYKALNKINDFLFKRAINRTIRKYKIVDHIVFNSFNPFYHYGLSKHSNLLLNIYQSVDNIGQSEYINKHGPALEIEYIKQADLTVTTSTHLKKELSQWSSNVHLVPNAADFNLFNTAEGALTKPKDFPDTSSAMIYTGNICNRLDYELLIDLVQTYPHRTLLMVGPVTNSDPLFDRLQSFNNVVFTGPKSINELPAYLKYSSCALIPFKINELTRSIYPLKVNEYLATGIPVVSTFFSEDIDEFSSVIHLSHDGIEFIKMVEIAISTDLDLKRENRAAVASNNTWSNRVNSIKDLVKEYLT